MTPQKVAIPSADGSAEALLYRSPDSDRAVVWAGGWRGGEPGGLPADVARALLPRGVSSLLVRYRSPFELPACVEDALASVSLLERQGLTRVAMVGHSFSGAVVISAAPRSERVVAVAALASQTYGAARADLVSPRPLLLVHGTEDERLSTYCSEQIYSWARQPKVLRFMTGASHSLREAREELVPLLADWLESKLGAGECRCSPSS